MSVNDSLAVAVLDLDDRTHVRSPVTDSLDGQVPRRIWREDGPPVLQPSSPDGYVSPEERLMGAFQELDSRRFGGPNLAAELCGGEGRRNFFCAFKERIGWLPGWLLDDGNPRTDTDARLRKRIDEIAGREGNSLDRLLAALNTPYPDGGLGVRYEINPHYWSWDAVEAFERGVGACHARSFLFYALATRAGLDPEFIRVSGRRHPVTGQIEELSHIGVAVRDNTGTLVPVDPSLGRVIDSNYLWFPISELEMQAYHLRNVAIYGKAPERRDEVEWRENILLQAVELAPQNFEIQDDVGRFYETFRKDPKRAGFHRDRARSLRPTLSAAW